MHEQDGEICIGAGALERTQRIHVATFVARARERAQQFRGEALVSYALDHIPPAQA